MSVGVGALLAPAAAAACPLDLVPPDVSPAWVAAAAAARARLERADAQDCHAIEVAVRPTGGALVTFTTTEGRLAVRALTAPDELGPALDALLATLPPEPPAAEPVPPAPPDAPPARDVVVGRPAPAPPPASPLVHFNIGAAGAVRLGLSGAYLTPGILLRPGGTFGPWELSGVVEYDPSYAYLPDGTPSFSLSSFGAALQVGRRERVGSFAFGFGGSIGLASVHVDTSGTDGLAQVAEYGQPRIGGFARLAIPREGSVRGTFDLGFDAAVGSLKRRATLRSDLPDLPRWGVVAALGVESSLL